MIRFDFQSLAVLAMATASSLAAAYGLNHIDERGAAQAAVIAPAAHARPAVRSSRAGSAQVRRAADGHYWAEAMIDGRAVRVLVDTGASVVALTREDGARLGLRLKPDDFTHTVQTASGPVRAAGLTLASVAIAGAEVRDVQALVVEEGLEQSLLGMSYLGRLSGFEATPAGLTLRP